MSLCALIFHKNIALLEGTVSSPCTIPNSTYLDLVADGVKLDVTSPGVQTSHIPRDGRMLSTNGGRRPSL